MSPGFRLVPPLYRGGRLPRPPRHLRRRWQRADPGPPGLGGGESTPTLVQAYLGTPAAPGATSTASGAARTAPRSGRPNPCIAEGYPGAGWSTTARWSWAVCAGFQLCGAAASPTPATTPTRDWACSTSPPRRPAGGGGAVADIDPGAPSGIDARAAAPPDRVREPRRRLPPRNRTPARWPTWCRGWATGPATAPRAWSGRVVGTYLHCPVLARNVALADLLLGWALGDGADGLLTPLDDPEEDALRAERLAAVASNGAGGRSGRRSSRR